MAGDDGDVFVPAGAGGLGGVAGQGAGEAGAAGRGAAAGAAGAAGASGAMGGAGAAGEAPCEPEQTRCIEGKRQRCGPLGAWGLEEVCEVDCNETGSACVFPTQVIVNDDSVCSLLSDGTARCWGTRGAMLGTGEFGGSVRPAKVLGVKGAKRLVRGGGSVCALREGEAPMCWGTNVYGTLNPSESSTIYTPVELGDLGGADVLALALGDFYLCLLAGPGPSHRVLCRGSNGVGQLGNHTSESYSTPFVEVAGLPSIAVRELRAGRSHSCVLLADNSIYCWGPGYLGQTGNPTYESTWQVNKVKLPAGATPAHIEAGGDFTCAILNDERVLCWGDNFSGELGRGVDFHYIGAYNPDFVIGLDDVAEARLGPEHVCARKGDELWCWGSNHSSELGHRCDETFRCEFRSDGIDYAFYRAEPSRVRLDSITSFDAGPGWVNGGTTCALAGHDIYCWGYTQWGYGEENGGYPWLSADPFPIVWHDQTRNPRVMVPEP